MTDLIEVKTADLAGEALNWAVAVVAHGKVYVYPDGGLCPPEGTVSMNDDDGTLWVNSGGFHPKDQWAPSTNWAQGGPLFDEHWPTFSFAEGLVRAEVIVASGQMFSAIGPDYLVAACRAIVAARHGEPINVPKELTP
ncbi:phage protein NinX family protein [Pseudomonas xantholysinigenes]|uniref:DUF2591 domain-containing protein n=1 Tax=Pseudomonas xantholysinigenes TaxID=2745490 RepID=A0A9E6TZV3_9PSED|nr:phage protein NinX family protein [Pseudomonas xantholysinigenes]QXI40446.1 DUF2591 domain-containing protein [Pseudomonas xantholysinigenes]